jgi:protein SCO1
VDEVLLYCYHYDPQAGKYSATIFRILRLAAAATMLAVGTLMMVLLRRGSGSNPRGVARAT